MPPSCRAPTSTWRPRSRSSGPSATTSPHRGAEALIEYSAAVRPRGAGVTSGCPRRPWPPRPRPWTPTCGPPSRPRSPGGGRSAPPSSEQPSVDVELGPGRTGQPADDPGRTGRALRARRAGPARLQRDHERGARPRSPASPRSPWPRRRSASSAGCRTPASWRSATCSGSTRCTPSAAPRRSRCSRTGCPGCVRRVDLVTGPGNIYVVAAKRLLKGRVNIDSEAGPTEIAVLADDTGRPGARGRRPDLPGRARPARRRRAGHRLGRRWPRPSRPSCSRSRCRRPSTPSGSRTALAGRQSAVVLVDDLDAGDRRGRTRTRPSTWRSRPPTPTAVAARITQRRRDLRRPLVAGLAGRLLRRQHPRAAHRPAAPATPPG